MFITWNLFWPSVEVSDIVIYLKHMKKWPEDYKLWNTGEVWQQLCSVVAQLTNT